MKNQSTTTGAGIFAAQKPVPFYYGQRAEQTPLERIDNLEKQILNAREMLATIERDGAAPSALYGFYKSRVYRLGLKLQQMRQVYPDVFFSVI